MNKNIKHGLVLITFAICLFIGVRLSLNNSKEIQSKDLAQQLMEQKTPYIGDNSKVVALIDLIPLRVDGERREVALQTQELPYGLSIKYELSEEAEDSPMVLKSAFEQHAILLLALIENADYVVYSTKALDYKFSRESIGTIGGVDVREKTKTQDDLRSLIDILYTSEK